MKRVLVIGDGIAQGYCKYLENFLGGEYLVVTKQDQNQDGKSNNSENSGFGDSRTLLEYFKDQKLRDNLEYDIIIFNCGLHDIKYYWFDEKIQVEIGEYESNLRRICAVLKSCRAKIYFVNSTPVYDEIHNSTKNILLNEDFVRRPNDIEKYNQIAEDVMYDNNIKIIDLYTLTKEFGYKGLRDHIHYYPEFEEKQGKYISQIIKEENK